jgi:Flp pilus assembly pilin Flp
MKRKMFEICRLAWGRLTWGRTMRWHQDQTGATAVEYAVMLALIILACFASVILLGSNLNSSWTNSSNSIQTVTGS